METETEKSFEMVLDDVNSNQTAKTSSMDVDNFDRIDFSKGLPVNLTDLGLTAADENVQNGENFEKTDETVEKNEENGESSVLKNDKIDDADEKLIENSPPPVLSREIGENSSEILENSLENFENSAEILENSLEILENSLEKFENSAENLETSAETLESSMETLENSAENLENSAENLENQIPDIIVVEKRPRNDNNKLETNKKQENDNFSDSSSVCEVIDDDEDDLKIEKVQNNSPETVADILKAAISYSGAVTDQEFVESFLKFFKTRLEASDARLIDVIRRFFDEQYKSRPLGVKKLLDNGKIAKPSAIFEPPSTVVHLLAEFQSDDSFTTLKEKFREPGRSSKPPPTDISHKMQFARHPCPNFSRVLYDVGFSMCMESTYRNILSKRSKDGKSDDSSLLKSTYEGLRAQNAFLKFKQHRCTVTGCRYAADTVISLDIHRQQPHRSHGRWLCGVCGSFKSGDRLEISEHYLNEHQLTADFERDVPRASCTICDEDFNTKAECKNHFRDCRLRHRFHKPMAPSETDADVINKWLWPKTRQAPPDLVREVRENFKPANVSVQQVKTVRKTVQDVVESVSLGEGRLMPRLIRPIAPAFSRNPSTTTTFLLRNGNSLSVVGQSGGQPNILVKGRPTSRQPVSTNFTMVCELCDAYFDTKLFYIAHLRDLHHQLMDKADIQLTGPAPLACSKCKERFYTYDGLERHLLMKHCLVTSDLLQKAHRKEDKGKCKLCGKVYAFNLLHHLVQDHKQNLCSAEILYNCDLCPFQCKSYILLDNHLKNSHSQTGKRLLPSQTAPQPRFSNTVPRYGMKRPTLAPAPVPQPKYPRLEFNGSRFNALMACRPSGPFKSVARTFVPGAPRGFGSGTVGPPGSRTVGAEIPQKKTLRYCCTPCNLKFATYEEVIDHWRLKHLRQVRVNVCRVDDCRACHLEFAKNGIRTDFNEYEYNLKPEELKIISEPKPPKLDSDDDCICID